MSPHVFAAIFDLDGVLTSTSVRHEQSWAEAAARFGLPVSEAALQATRSVPRPAALSALLGFAGREMGETDRQALMEFKNERYHQLIEGLRPDDAFPGAREALVWCRELGVKVAVASASLNAPLVLERIGLGSLVDFVADPQASAPKPDAEIYLRACEALGALPHTAICVEDGKSMIANLRAAGMWTVGIGAGALEADEQFGGVGEWDVGATLARVKRRA